MKKLMKVFFIFLIIITCVNIMPVNHVEAATVGSVIKRIRAKNPDDGLFTDMQTLVGTILGLLQIAAGLTTIVMVAFLGFKLLSTTPPDMKKDLKERFLPIIIGLVVVFGAVSIAKFMVGVVK